ncbi:MAG: ABC transporter substrate-binding protein, partial [Oscillospiraceae bacterium]|nr:ABC transporter substrate-binding protein [Oscillospiraceae bacterium]
YSKAILSQNDIDVAAIHVAGNGSMDISAIGTKIRSQNTDLVFWCGNYSNGSSVIKQLRNGGYTGGIVVSEGSASHNLIEYCGVATEDVYVIAAPFIVDSDEQSAAFFVDYESMWGVIPGEYAALAYDTMYILKNAIENANTTETDNVRNAIQNSEYYGISGLIRFTEERERDNSNYVVYQIGNERFRLVSLD